MLMRMVVCAAAVATKPKARLRPTTSLVNCMVSPVVGRSHGGAPVQSHYVGLCRARASGFVLVSVLISRLGNCAVCPMLLWGPNGKRPVLAVTSRGLGSWGGSGKSALMQ